MLEHRSNVARLSMHCMHVEPSLLATGEGSYRDRGASHLLGLLLADDVLVHHGHELPRRGRCAQARSRRSCCPGGAGAAKAGDAFQWLRSLHRLQASQPAEAQLHDPCLVYVLHAFQRCHCH